MLQSVPRHPAKSPHAVRSGFTWTGNYDEGCHQQDPRCIDRKYTQIESESVFTDVAAATRSLKCMSDGPRGAESKVAGCERCRLLAVTASVEYRTKKSEVVEVILLSKAVALTSN
jgi:hypothetical protein